MISTAFGDTLRAKIPFASVVVPPGAFLILIEAPIIGALSSPAMTFPVTYVWAFTLKARHRLMSKRIPILLISGRFRCIRIYLVSGKRVKYLHIVKSIE